MRQLGVDVSRETSDRLDSFVETLARWQKTINLVSRATLDEVWIRHILDSAQIVPLIPQSAQTLADLGSGAGLPGLVIAALMPHLHITLVESDARKAAFLGEAARRMGLPKVPTVKVGRIESVPSLEPDVITARALAPLSQLMAWAARHKADTTICLFHKGKGWPAELTEAKKEWDISCQATGSSTDLDSVILRIAQFTRRR